MKTDHLIWEGKTKGKPIPSIPIGLSFNLMMTKYPI